MHFARRFGSQTKRSAVVIHTDGGQEFTRALAYFIFQGVDTSTTAASSPRSNGLTERTHGVFLLMTMTSLLQDKLPYSFWTNALRYMTDFRNSVENSKTRTAS